MKAHKGIYYFPTEQDALLCALDRGFPTNRIMQYGLGWAIQCWPSGPYFGPDCMTMPERTRRNFGL